MQTTNRVALNTSFLYGKMIVTIIVSLYSTHLVLDALGVVDYGIFNLVGGVIGMLSFLNGAMTVSTQRYLSFYLGAKESDKLKSVYSSSVVLHLFIGLAVVLILELAGLILFNGFLNIPENRVHTAKIVFHFMVISTFFTINSVPNDAAINAHENMIFEALSGIFEAVAKLGIAFWIVMTNVDKLILYGFLIAGLTIGVRVLKTVYCRSKYEECRVKFPGKYNKDLFREMFSFAGWNLFGSFCSVVRNQGLAIVLNLFVGVIANAAYGIANLVNGQLSAFSMNMMKALNPQIIKSEGSGNRARMLQLAILACKISFFLLAFFGIPLIIEMPYVLKIWLHVVPEQTIIFCRLILIMTMIQLLTWGLMVAIQSVGKIKIYQIVMGSILIMNLPLSWALLKLGFPSYSVLICAISLEIIAGGIRILFAGTLTGLSKNIFLRETVLYSVISIGLAAFLAYIPSLILEEGFGRLVLTGFISSAAIIIFTKFIALSSSENEKINEILLSFTGFVRKKLDFMN